MPLDQNVAGLLQMMAAAGTPQLHEGTPEQARAALRTLMVDLRHPSTLAEVASVDETTIGGVPCRVYRPLDAAHPLPTIVYLHGGGFVIGDLDTHEGVCRRLARDVGAVVVSADYRLAPENPFPAAVEDAYAVLQAVAEDLSEYGGDATRLVVGGDSAGGNLAAVCAQLALADDLPLAAQVLVYPAVDFSGDYPSRTENGEGYFLTRADMDWFAENYTGIAGGAAALTEPAAAAIAADPRLSPLLAPSLSGLAPAIVATAEFDPLRDEGNTYAEALTAAGVPVRQQQFAGLIHGFYGLEQISPAIDAATTWINAQLTELLAQPDQVSQ